jgi:hypothetical protein
MNVMRMLLLSMTFSVLVLAGCAGTPQTRFYTLTPMTLQQAGTPAVEAKKVTVNISPVEIPDYLNRQQIVTRDGGNELKLADLDRWAGSIAESMAIVLAENLSQLLGSEQVFVHPRLQSATPDYTVALRVLQLDCVPGDQARLKAQWTVLAGAERKEAITRISNITEKLEDKQYATIAAAVSRILEQLSGDIVREIQARSAGRQLLQ